MESGPSREGRPRFFVAVGASRCAARLARFRSHGRLWQVRGARAAGTATQQQATMAGSHA